MSEKKERVLLVSIANDAHGTCSIDHCILLAQAPFESSTYGHLHITFAESAADALKEFRASKDYDTLIVVRSDCSNYKFIQRALASGYDCVVGMHTVPRIDWDSVAAGGPACKYEPDETCLDDGELFGYRRMKAGAHAYDFEQCRNLPPCFVLRHKYSQRADDAIYVDTAAPFTTTSRLAFEGVIKLRFAAGA